MNDLMVVFLYLGLVFLLAFFSRRQALASSESENDQDIVEGQYLASRSLSIPESLGSIIATEVSALTFLGIPAFAFSNNYSFIHIYLGAIIGRALIALIIVPRIYNKGLTLYSIMGKAGSSQMGSKLTGLIYSITKLLAVGVRLYAGSILVAEFFDLSIILALVLITGMTFFYTLIGGLKAVVRTDLLQTILFVGGGIAAHIIIPDIAKTSWSTLYEMAVLGGKTEIINMNNLTPFLIGVSGGVLFDLCTHGVDQDFTQRLMGANSKKTAQRAIFFSSFFSIGVGLLFLSIGALLWSYYQLNPSSVPLNSDKIFAQFITDFFPTPLKGLMLAGVLAATMSTLDSTINALSSVVWSELLPNRNIKKIKKYMTLDTLVISVLLLVVAILASYSEGILLLGLKIASWSGGVLAALFFSQLVWQGWTKGQMNAPSVILAYGFNLLGVGLNSFLIKGPWQYNVYYGMFFATVALKLLSLRSVKDPNSE
jgi:SSS family solute:Na+ symporter